MTTVLVITAQLTLANRLEANEDVASGSWFHPTLTTKRDPICGAFLSHAINPDSAYSGLIEVPPFFSDDDRGKSTVQSVPNRPELLSLAQRNGEALYVEHVRNPGCGGACESESLAVHARPPSPDHQDEKQPTTPPSLGEQGWSIYETPSGQQYVAAVVEGHQVEVYRPTPAPQWSLICRIQLEPDLEHSKDPKVQLALASIHTLREVTSAIALGDGYGMCGTMHTAGRWEADFQHAVDLVLFDPDATTVTRQRPASDNSYGDYSRIYPALEDWSLGGLFEFGLLHRYDMQLEETTAVVSAFYQYKFHWTAAHALEVAGRSIRDAVSHRFGFYMYEPYPATGERELRRAILSHQPMEAIRAIDFDIKAIDKSGYVDSILNVAIEYPDALGYLLSRGADPNQANAFGKTPLMYAAQYNALHALQILLHAGANPNAVTNIAPDDCSYAIQTSRVTPLHYAVKNAGRDVVQALLSAGAVTYIQSQIGGTTRGSYPVEWLSNANAKLTPEDRKALEALLRVPSDSERAKVAVALTAAAEAANAAGNSAEAYRSILLAGFADSENARVIADFPILALKAGAIGPALEGSARAIDLAKTPADKAAGLFNYGLACLQATPGQWRYNNQYYCQNGLVDPFLQAWKTLPNSSRATKLVQLFSSGERANCMVTFPDGGVVTARFQPVSNYGVPNGQVERIYAMHSPSLVLEPSAIRWEVPYTAPRKVITPHVVEHLALTSENELTILEGEGFARSVFLNDHECLIE